MYKPIPVDEARRIAAEYDKTMVVILAYDPQHVRTHTTTYGVSAAEKEQAAAVGELCTKAVGGDLSSAEVHEDFLFAEAKEILRTIHRCQGTNPPMLQRVERWLKATGHPLRQA